MIQPSEGFFKFTPEGEPAPAYWVDDFANLRDFIERLYAEYDMMSDISFVELYPVEYAAEPILNAYVRIPTPSVFKRAAAFTLGFMQESPLHLVFNASDVGDKIGHMKNHQNAIVAFGYARQCLHKASYVCGGENVVLEQPIKVSAHFYTDLLYCLTTILPKKAMASAPSFHSLSLLYEDMAYRCNGPSCHDAADV